jgi:chemotaxis protein methyltransferase CheR
MMPCVSPSEAERFRDVIVRRLGLAFDDSKQGFLAELLRRRIEATGLTGDDYLGSLEAGAARSELSALAPELTVGETYFFRNREQFAAVAERCLPERMRARARERRLRLLSAGCASGEEAYSLAMLVREHVSDPAWDVPILGVDVNPAALARAERARYTPWSLRETAPEIRQRWFRNEGADLVLDPAIRGAVRFEERNLAEDEPGLWPVAAYDVVFCRNMLMYLSPAHAQRLIGWIARALAPGGFLFLGHVETLRGISSDFDLCQTHETFYYRRKAAADPGPLADGPPAAAPMAAPAPADGWFEAIHRATARISTLAGEANRAEAEPPARPADLGPVLELLRRERFAEALRLVESHPAIAAGDPEAMLLRAVLLTHSRQIAEAEACCGALLKADACNAGAHYLLALCGEAAGRAGVAIGHDRAAIYLDRGFAMPHLHLGLLARGRGDDEAAKRHFAQAEALLRREDPSRLLLFGGGFSRAALISLCRPASGGAP